MCLNFICILLWLFQTPNTNPDLDLEPPTPSSPDKASHITVGAKEDGCGLVLEEVRWTISNSSSGSVSGACRKNRSVESVDQKSPTNVCSILEIPIFDEC